MNEVESMLEELRYRGVHVLHSYWESYRFSFLCPSKSFAKLTEKDSAGRALCSGFRRFLLKEAI